MAATLDKPKPKLALLAYICSPDRGSEAAIGWNQAVAAAKTCQTWVICVGDDFGADVRRYLAARGEIPDLHFEFIERTWLERLLRRLPGMYYPAYNLWHRRAFRAAKRLHQVIAFDLAHQLNLCGYREPGYLGQLGVPWIWGPIGGTQIFPWRFLKEVSLPGAAREVLRNVLNVIQLRYSRRVRQAARKAARLLVGTTDTRQQFERLHGRLGTPLAVNGVPSVVAQLPSRPGGDGPLRILWAGRHQDIKALPLLLKALARLPEEVPYRLRVLGDGPRRTAWQRLARKLGMEPHVEWTGWIPYRETLLQYQWADVFAFTSLRDTLPTVVLEALANGLPVICFDHQGLDDVVGQEGGVCVEATDPERAIRGLADAVSRMARDERLRRKLAGGARERAQRFLWPRLGQQMARVYQDVLDEAGRPSQPAEGRPAVTDRAARQAVGAAESDRAPTS